MKACGWHRTRARVTAEPVELRSVGRIHAFDGAHGVHFVLVANDGRRLALELSATEWAELKRRGDASATQDRPDVKP